MQTTCLTNEVSSATLSGRVDTDTDLRKESPKVLKTTSELFITTFNTCTLTKEFYMEELLNSIEKHKFEITSIIEHRILHDEPIKYHNLSSEYTLITSSASVNSSNASVGGVGTVLSKLSINCLLSAEHISSRILVLTFSGKPETTHICCYSPHNQSPEEKVLEFYEKLSEVMRQIPAHNVVFLCGDFNAQLGTDKVHHSYHQYTNRNGEHLVNFL